MNLDIGSMVGDYQIIAILGAGGMGKVFKVRNTISDRVEAMKVLLPDLAVEPELADRFLREIKVHASLDHPNIASLRTALRFGNQLLMVMELVEGVDLENKLKQGKLPAAEAANYIGQALDALAYAHRAGVIHRDIKPANMMLTPNGVIKLMDFGIAKGAADRKLTMTGTTMGSLYYMSPEQIQGAATLDKRTDLYAVGVSLYELVTGMRPFDGDSQFAIMAAHLEKVPVPPITLDPTVPAALNEVILHSVGKNPDERYQSAEEFHAALRAINWMSAAGTVRMKTAPVPVGATVVSPRPAPVSAPALPVTPPPVSARPPVAVPPVAAAVAATPAAAPTPAKSRRGMWVAVGALCAAGVVIGVIELSPTKPTAAGGAAPTTSVTAPVSTPGSQASPVPALTSPAASPSTSPVETKRGAAVTPANPPATQKAASQSVRTENPPPQSQPQSQPQSVAAPPPQQQVQQVQQAPPAQPAGPSAAEIAAKRAEIKKTSDALILLSARAGAVHNKLTGIQRGQGSGGMSMRSDWLTSQSLMDTFLKQAENALNGGDPAAAKEYMDKAEHQVETLEKALHM